MKPEIKKRAGRRLKIIAGQIKGLEKMVEAEAYCVAIITQSAAVKEALSSFEDLILKNHLRTHVAEQMKGRASAKAVAEILAVYRLAKKH